MSGYKVRCISCRMRWVQYGSLFNLSPSTTQLQALRKVFASSDRKRPTNQTAVPIRNIESVSLSSIQRDADNSAGGDWDHMQRASAVQQLDGKTGARQCSNNIAEEDHKNLSTEYKYQPSKELASIIPKAPGHSDEATDTATAPSSLTNESGWNFDRFLEEQRRNEIQHDDRKDKIFQKVCHVFDTRSPYKPRLYSPIFKYLTA